jgi:hypothetical protein
VLVTGNIITIMSTAQMPTGTANGCQ